MSGSFQLSWLHRLRRVVSAGGGRGAQLGGVSVDPGGDEAAPQVPRPADDQIDRVGLAACPRTAAEKLLAGGSLATAPRDFGLPT
jgi:hypothetical protein